MRGSRSSRGSSPLTRGKRDALIIHIETHGLIPTHAGKTGSPAPVADVLVAHPHSRGENAFHAPHRGTSTGSSPLTRGKPLAAVRRGGGHGLIPTHAGKTRSNIATTSDGKAHPHSRGENLTNKALTRAYAGSSPLTRGKHFLTCAFIAQIGQILESLELCASSESYSLMDAYATDAPQDQVRSTGLAPRRSRDAS